MQRPDHTHGTAPAGFATSTIHGGRAQRTAPTPPVVTPIYQTAAYEMPSAVGAKEIFHLERDGQAYSRLNNPTCDVLEERITEVDGGAAALAVASGQAAVSLAILALCQAGDNFVSARELYGGTWNLFANTLRRMGIETRFVDGNDPGEFLAATDDRTRCYFGEMLPNPSLRLFNVEDVAEAGLALGIPLIVDNTMLPGVCRTFELGAAINVYSATKYIGGHGSTLGGLIVDSGRFDWMAHGGRHPLMTLPDEAHGGVVWPEAGRALKTPMGRSPYLLKVRETLLRDLGPCLSPFNAFLLLQGIETLGPRMRVHTDNAVAVARFLVEHPKVAAAHHPSLATGAEGDRVKRYLGDFTGPMVNFELRGGTEAGGRFIEALRVFTHATNIGDVRSYATHPASTTHAQMPPEAQLTAGVTPGLVRLAVGTETVDDLVADLDQALGAA